MNTSIKKTSSNKEFAKNCIMDALLQLMHTKDYEQISISELARKAGVSRMSYYRNYSSKDSILIDYMYHILQEYVEELKGPSFQSDFQTYDHILRSLKYLNKYKDYVLCLKKANRSEILLKGLDLYMLYATETFNKSNLEKYQLYYYSGALYNIFMHWLEDDMKEDIEVIASIIYEHVRYSRFNDKKGNHNLTMVSFSFNCCRRPESNRYRSISPAGF